MSSAKWRPFCLGLNVLSSWGYTAPGLAYETWVFSSYGSKARNKNVRHRLTPTSKICVRWWSLKQWFIISNRNRRDYGAELFRFLQSVAQPVITIINGNIFRVTGPFWGNPSVTGSFPSQWQMTPSFEVFFDLRLNKRLSKQSRRRWFQTPLFSSWRHCKATNHTHVSCFVFFLVGCYCQYYW